MSNGRRPFPSKGAMQDLTSAAANLAVVIITLNEQERLGLCLGALPAGVEIIVLDSGSSDRTCAIAASHGAHVATRAFTNFAEQKNFAIDMATRPWVLSLDADEVLDAQAIAALPGLTAAAEVAKNGFVAYRLRRRLVFLGRPLHFGKAVDRPIRLFRRGSACFVSDIHEGLVVDGRVGQLPGEARHFSYADLTDYFRRFNDYTSRVADNHRRMGRAQPFGLVHWLRPWFEFFYRYVVRLGFLDGYPGYVYALISSLYTFIKYAKLKELTSAGKGPA